MRYLLFLISIYCTLHFSSCRSTNIDTPILYENCCNTTAFELKTDSTYVFIPNAFTPNADGINDNFVIYTGGKINKLNFLFIENPELNGKYLFELHDVDLTLNPNIIWGGTINDTVKHAGHFNYTLSLSTLTSPLAIIKGNSCSILCDSSSQLLKNNINCQYPIQINSLGEFDKQIDPQEMDCYK